MAEEIEQRAYKIVEELRADIDFELDDVISQIVRGLPEDYFTMLSHEDQLRQLKALLAMGVCDLDEEIMLRNDDGRQIAVVARRNFPGLLSNILKRIPSAAELIGAKIFTSTDNNFIIDLFEFKANDSADAATLVDPASIANTIDEVARLTGQAIEQIKNFVSRYDSSNRILSSPKDVAEQFLVFHEHGKSNETVVRWVESTSSNRTRVTISSKKLPAREVFQRTAEFLAGLTLDIERAFLHNIPMGGEDRIAIASFWVTGSAASFDSGLDKMAANLASFLQES